MTLSPKGKIRYRYLHRITTIVADFAQVELYHLLKVINAALFEGIFSESCQEKSYFLEKLFTPPTTLGVLNDLIIVCSKKL